MNVLLIEDNPGDARLVQEMLSDIKNEQFEVHHRASLIDGLSALRTQHIDIILLDFSLPDSHGLETFTAIRTHAPNVPVVLLTGYDDERLVREAITKGAQDYLGKNDLNPHELGRALRYAVLRHSSARIQSTQSDRPEAKMVGILGSKGGVGATTMACRIAVELTRQTSSRVLLGGLDTLTGTGSLLMRVTSQYSLLDAAMNLSRLDQDYWRGLVAQTQSGVDVLQAPGALSMGSELSADRIRHVLRFARMHYEWIVLDLGRPDAPAMEVVQDLDELCLIATEEVPSLREAKRIIERLADVDPVGKRIRLLINCVGDGSPLQENDFKRVTGAGACLAIPHSEQIRSAFKNGLLDDRALQPQIRSLVAEIAGIPAAPETGGRWFPFRLARTN